LLETLAELLPGRRVVGIHAVDLVLGLGTLHCMTQQEPAGSPRGGESAPGLTGIGASPLERMM